MDNTQYDKRFTNRNKIIAKNTWYKLPKNQPVMVWVRFSRGRVELGVGYNIGDAPSIVIAGYSSEHDMLGGGYSQFAIGRIGRHPHTAFELLEVQPMELRGSRNRFF